MPDLTTTQNTAANDHGQDPSDFTQSYGEVYVVTNAAAIDPHIQNDLMKGRIKAGDFLTIANPMHSDVTPALAVMEVKEDSVSIHSGLKIIVSNQVSPQDLGLRKVFMLPTQLIDNIYDNSRDFAVKDGKAYYSQGITFTKMNQMDIKLQDGDEARQTLQSQLTVNETIRALHEKHTEHKAGLTQSTALETEKPAQSL